MITPKTGNQAIYGNIEERMVERAKGKILNAVLLVQFGMSQFYLFPVCFLLF